METIASKIVSALRAIDHEQIEGGIYALPDRHSKGKWPASHHHLFGGMYQELDLCLRLGVKGQVRRDKRIEFNVAEEVASLQFIDIALTKVRSYGNRFQLDKHHGKKWEDCSTDLKKAVSSLVKEARRPGHTKIAFLVAFVFTDSEKHAADLIHPSTTEGFLSRYGLTLSQETWSDPHGRGIWTSVLCWDAGHD